MAFRTTETKSKERANYFREYLIIFKKNSLFNIIFYHINYGVIQGFPAGLSKDLPLADFGRLPERLLLSVRTKSINENFVN